VKKRDEKKEYDEPEYRTVAATLMIGLAALGAG
jgi:hypothetical protein